MLAPNLFTGLDPPGILLQLHRLDRPEADERLVSLHIHTAGRGALRASTKVSRYSPEWSIIRAVSETVDNLARAQQRLDSMFVADVMRRNFAEWVDPF